MANPVCVWSFALLLLIGGIPNPSRAEVDWPSLRVPLLDRQIDRFENLRFTLDASQRFVYSDERRETALESFLGFDAHKVVSSREQDIGTLTLQGYLTRIHNQPAHPPFFEDEDDWEFVYRIFNFNYTGLTGGRLNFRVGRYEVPFGLEHSINTNGTLRDYTSPENLGMKADWGASVNGVLPWLEYEVGWQRGNTDQRHGEASGIVAGRVGTSSERRFAVGLSGFHGRVSNERAVGLWKRGLADPGSEADIEHILRRTRFGIDAHYEFSRFTLLGEASLGDDRGQGVRLLLLELDWHASDDRTVAYLQLKAHERDWDSGWEDQTSGAFGIRFAPDRHWSVSTQISQQFTTFGDGERDTLWAFQLRYRY